MNTITQHQVECWALGAIIEAYAAIPAESSAPASPPVSTPANLFSTISSSVGKTLYLTPSEARNDLECEPEGMFEHEASEVIASARTSPGASNLSAVPPAEALEASNDCRRQILGHNEVISSY